LPENNGLSPRQVLYGPCPFGHVTIQARQSFPSDSSSLYREVWERNLAICRSTILGSTEIANTTSATVLQYLGRKPRMLRTIRCKFHSVQYSLHVPTSTRRRKYENSTAVLCRSPTWNLVAPAVAANVDSPPVAGAALIFACLTTSLTTSRASSRCLRLCIDCDNGYTSLFSARKRLQVQYGVVIVST
jgi:hypothetical protein